MSFKQSKDGKMKVIIQGAPEPKKAPEIDHSAPLVERIIANLRHIYDPEMPLNIYDLGLIYGIELDDFNNVTITMTLTAPNCPAADFILEEVRTKTAAFDDVNKVTVNLVWDPPWTRDSMSDEAKLELGLL